MEGLASTSLSSSKTARSRDILVHCGTCYKGKEEPCQKAKVKKGYNRNIIKVLLTLLFSIHLFVNMDFPCEFPDI